MLRSLVQTHNVLNPTEDIRQWIATRNHEVGVSVEQIPFDEMDGWKIEADGSLRHQSGKFFSIEGIRVTTDYTCHNANGRGWESVCERRINR